MRSASRRITDFPRAALIVIAGAASLFAGPALAQQAGSLCNTSNKVYSPTELGHNDNSVYICNGSSLVTLETDTASPLGVDFLGTVGIGTATPGALLDIGSTGGTLGTLRLESSTASSYVQMQPSTTSGSWTMTLPASAGTSGYVLQTDGTGITSWVANGSGATITLGTSATATNPQRSSQAGTGLFSAATGQVSVATGGNEIERLSTGIAIGTSYVGTSPPTNGAIVQGNVGIGTASPSEPLTVIGNSLFGIGGTPGSARTLTVNGSSTQLPLIGFDSGAGEYSIMGLPQVSGQVFTDAAVNDMALRATGALRLGGYYNSSSVSSTLVIGLSTSSFNGTVGIGTTSPGAALDVQTAPTVSGGAAYGERLQQTLTATANNNSLTALYINPTFTDGSYTGVANNGLIVASGTVGIGTTTPNSLVQAYNGEVQVGSSGASCSSSNAGAVRWTGTQFQLCTGSTWTIVGVYDLASFYPGSPPANAITRVVSVRSATFPASLTGSYCVAKSGATASTTININKIHSGSSSGVATVTFSASGSANQTCTLSSAGFSLAVGDALEFAFPSSPDATLADIAITLAGTYQ